MQNKTHSDTQSKQVPEHSCCLSLDGKISRKKVALSLFLEVIVLSRGTEVWKGLEGRCEAINNNCGQGVGEENNLAGKGSVLEWGAKLKM